MQATRRAQARRTGPIRPRAPSLHARRLPRSRSPTAPYDERVSRPARYAKGLAKREEILNTALEVIARTGYGRTSVRELASAVGLSQAGLLHYFASKEELFAEILLKRDRVDHDRSEPEAGSEIAALASIVRHNAEVPGLVQLYDGSRWRPPSPDTPRTRRSCAATRRSGHCSRTRSPPASRPGRWRPSWTRARSPTC